MQYNRLTNDELERRVYIEPGNEEAKAELLRRVPELMDQEADEIEEAKQELEIAIEQHKGEMEAKDEEIKGGDETITELEGQLRDANTRIYALEDQIAEVINSRDLV